MYYSVSVEKQGQVNEGDIYALRKATKVNEDDPALQKFKRNRYFYYSKTPASNNIQRLRQRYNLKVVRTPPFKGASNIVIPLVRYVCQAVAERLFLSHFSSEPYVLIRPVRTQTNVALIEQILFHYQRKQSLKEWYRIITDAVLLGTGVGYKTLLTPQKDEINTPTPYTKYVPVEDFYIYPETSSLRDVIAVGHREVMSLKEIVETYDLPYDLVDKVIGSALPPADTDTLRVETANAGWGVAEVYRTVFYCDGEYYEVHELRNPSVFLLFRKYPYKVMPYILYTIMPSASVFGTGLGQLLEPFEEEITELHNLRLDNHQLTNLPIFKVRKGSTAQKVDVFEAGMKIPVETLSDIEPLLMPQQFRGLIDEERALFDLALQVSGLNEIVLGQQAKPYSTAYAVETALLEGAVRFKSFFSSGREAIKRSSLIDLLMLKKEADEVYVSSLISAPSPLLSISMEDIIRETEFIIEPNTTSINRETDKQRWLIVRQLFQDTLTPTGRWEVDAHILRLMGITNVEVFIGEKPEGEPLPPAMMTTMSPFSIPMNMPMPEGTGGMPV